MLQITKCNDILIIGKNILVCRRFECISIQCFLCFLQHVFKVSNVGRINQLTKSLDVLCPIILEGLVDVIDDEPLPNR